MVMAGPATWLVNANPLMKMDGYYALADAINVPNLRMHGRNFWASLLDRVLLGLPSRPCLLNGWRRWAAVIHAAASLVFTAAWMSGLIIAISQWGGPVGLIVTVAAVILWCAAPVGMWFSGHWIASAEPEARNRRPRLIATAVLGITLIAIGLNTSSPLRRSVPVMVQYRDEQIVRAAAAGFVTEVNVESGQWVKKGDLLLVIKDDDLVLRHAQMKDELELAISKQRQLASRGELGAAEAQGETVRSLKDSLAELDESIVQLQASASRSGVVVSPHPERQIGRHVKKGDVLLRVADPSDKELLVVFPEAEWSGYSRVFSKGNELRARLRGGYRVSVKPLPARPRFSDRLPNPSFAGSGGGDIPVIQDPDAEDGFRAASPVGEAVAMLTPIDSKHVHSGQRGRLYLTDTRTIAQRIWIYLGGE
jgi:putative peptide zinc metalloprotease protein